MSDLGRGPGTGEAQDALEQRLAADQRALQEETERGLWPLSRIHRAVADRDNRRTSEGAGQEHGHGHGHGEGGLHMVARAMNKLRLRPRVASGLIGAALIGGVLLMPISYQRTVGHDVTIELGAGLPLPQVKELAQKLKRAASAERVEVRMQGDHLRLHAVGRDRQRAAVEQRTAELLRGLREQKVEATVQIEPRRERVESRVYAAALSVLIDIRVDTTGKTDRQVEDEIRDQLSRAGASPKDVQFERRTDGTHLSIEAETGGRMVKVIRDQKDPSGTPSSEVAVKVEPIDDTREPGMTDDQLRDKIKRQLEARGLDTTVTVSGDHIEVRAHHRRTP